MLSDREDQAKRGREMCSRRLKAAGCGFVAQMAPWCSQVRTGEANGTVGEEDGGRDGG